MPNSMVDDCRKCVVLADELLEKNNLVNNEKWFQLIGKMDRCPSVNPCCLANITGVWDILENILVNLGFGNCSRCIFVATFITNVVTVSTIKSDDEKELRKEIGEIFKTCKPQHSCPLRIFAKISDIIQGELIRQESEECSNCIDRIDRLTKIYHRIIDEENENENALMAIEEALKEFYKLQKDCLMRLNKKCPYFILLEACHDEIVLNE